MIIFKRNTSRFRLSRMAKMLAIFSFMSLVSPNSFGQSDNYWSWNSNTHSTLLAGAVVGGLSGPSSIFYNPALINHENLPSLSLSANLLSFQFYNIENIAGDNLDADKFKLKVQPRFISYVLPTANNRVGIQFALMSPVSENIEYARQYEAELDIIERTEGEEEYNGLLSYRRDFNDTWGGVGVSYELTENLYVGASGFLSFKQMEMTYLKSIEVYQRHDSVLVSGNVEPRYISTSGFEETLNYWYWSVVFKTGVQYTTLNNRLSLGLNLTMPDIPIIGSGDARKRYYRSNIYHNGSGNFVSNENTLGVLEESDVRVKNPFSIAIGGVYYFEKRTNVLLFTAEYFSQIQAYDIVSSRQTADWLPENIAQHLNAHSFMDYSYEGKSVTNLALGYKNVISDDLAYLGGVRTDFTNGNPQNINFVDGSSGVNQLHMNKWHFTSGLLLEMARFKVLAGLQYTYARSGDVMQAANFSNPVEYNPLTDQSLDGERKRVASGSLNELTLFFGISITGK